MCAVKKYLLPFQKRCSDLDRTPPEHSVNVSLLCYHRLSACSLSIKISESIFINAKFKSKLYIYSMSLVIVTVPSLVTFYTFMTLNMCLPTEIKTMKTLRQSSLLCEVKNLFGSGEKLQHCEWTFKCNILRKVLFIL